VNKLLRKPVVTILGILIVAMLWLAFRPELLFVNKSVDDPFPTTAATASAASVNLDDVKSVAIYRERFHVNFGAASLK
jgi:hypothetical protein